ncbi:hypothetical protein ACWGLF_34450 [Streptomyces puniciscabiei]
MIACAHGDAANVTWAVYGTVTTVARLSVRATYGPLPAPVWSKPPDRARTGMSLRVTSRTERGACHEI